MLEKSCFTDGKYIYAICYYVEDITEFQNDATRIEIEIYCPKTLAFIRSCIFTPEADIDDNLTQTEKDKISEDNYELQEAIESIQETLKFAAFTGNLQHESPNSNESDEIEAQTSSLLQCSKNSAVNTVALCINQVLYFFDLDTGKRYKDTVGVKEQPIGYDQSTGRFWNYHSPDDDSNSDSSDSESEAGKGVIKSFKVNCSSSSSQKIESQEMPTLVKEIIASEAFEPEVAQSLAEILETDDSVLEKEVSSSHANTSPDSAAFLTMFVFDLNCEELNKYLEKSEKLTFEEQLSLVVNHNFLTEKFLRELN